MQPGSGSLQLVAYQIPLKEKQNSPIGKVDAVGLLENGSVCLIELKAPQNRGDSPLRAFLEVLSYSAVVLEHHERFISDLVTCLPGVRVTQRPLALVLGPASWWNAWTNHPAAGDWRPPLRDLSNSVAEQVGIDIAYGSLDCFERSDLDFGSRGKAPKLLRVPNVANVEGLPGLCS